MKTIGIIFCLLSSVIFFSCNDTIGRVGLGIQPEEDKVAVFDTTFTFDARTIAVDSIYAKTPYGFLGEFYDPAYGSIKSSFICQYYPSIGFQYLDSIVDNKIDSVRLNLYYSEFIGDSLTPMEVTVYPVIKPLTENYYTNTDPSVFCDMNNPIAKYSYTARNKNLSDSLIQANITNGSYPFHISIPLPVKLGQDYLDKIRNGELKTVDEFLNFFPGTYLKTTFGTGSMLPIELATILVYCTQETMLQNVSGGDSIAYKPDEAVFAVTKEVIQLNKFENKNPAFLTEDSPDKTYIKTPAGVYTEITIPIKKIVAAIGKKKFSSVAFSLNAYPPEDIPFPLPIPGKAITAGYNAYGNTQSTGFDRKLLLIQPDSVKNFFEMKKVVDNQTAFTAYFNENTYTYNFTNIANLIQYAINNAPDKDLKLWVIPVQTTWVSQTTSSGYPAQMDYTTANDLYPSAVTLKKGGDNLKIRVIASDLKINSE